MSSELRNAIAEFPWVHQERLGGDRFVKWRDCFSDARVAILNHKAVPAAAFERMQGLETLDLEFSRFPVANLLAVNFSQLTILLLSNCSGLSDARLAALQCPLLTNLDLSFCSGITGAGLARLRCLFGAPSLPRSTYINALIFRAWRVFHFLC